MAVRRRSRDGVSDAFPGYFDATEIGAGALATVYRATEVGTGRLVALKLLNVRAVSGQAAESFERETTALGALSAHPNIVTLYRSFSSPAGRPVLVLELCTCSLADRVGAGDLPVRDAITIGIKLCGALETAHRARILHRDVKPQQHPDHRVRRAGAGRLRGRAAISAQSGAGLIDFTTPHVAPELLEGTPASAATDVYGLASTLYQLIAGHPAFRAFADDSPASIILRILRDPVQPLGRADVPVQLSDLLLAAMSKTPAERPASAAELGIALGEIEAAQGWPRTALLLREAPTGPPCRPGRPR